MANLQPAMTVPAEAPQAELPVAYIRSIKARLDARLQQLSELPGLIEQDRKLYEAALLFAPKGFDALVETQRIQPVEPGDAQREFELENAPKSAAVVKPAKIRRLRGELSWKSLVTRELENSQRGMAHPVLLKIIRSKYEMPVSNGEKGFYNAVAKSLHDGSLVKRGGLLYSAKTIADRKQRGEVIPDDIEPVHRVGSSAMIVQRVLAAHPDGLTGPDLKKFVGAEPDAPRSMREHGQYIYNILGTLLGTGSVTKVGNLYYLAKPQGSGNGQ